MTQQRKKGEKECSTSESNVDKGPMARRSCHIQVTGRRSTKKRRMPQDKTKEPDLAGHWRSRHVVSPT